MSEEEKKAIEILKVVNDTKYTCHYYTIEDLKAIDTILKLVEKQQKEIDILQTKIKQNENIEKIKMCMTHNMPNNAEIVCMVREDFERNFGNDYISKDKIREIIFERNFGNDYISKDKIREIIKDLEDFDTKFYSSEELKLAIKNSLKELLGEQDYARN